MSFGATGRQNVSESLDGETLLGVVTPALNGDPVMEEIMPGLAACIRDTLTAAGRPPCCAMWFRGNSRPPMDNCHCDCPENNGQGVAWVRMLNMENTAMTGTNPRISGFRADCAIPAPRWRITVEMGVYRCVPTGTPEEGLTCDEQTSIAANGHWDDLLLMQAANACTVIRNRRPVFIRVDPVGPQGGCAGSIVAMWLDYVKPKTP